MSETPMHETPMHETQTPDEQAGTDGAVGETVSKEDAVTAGEIAAGDTASGDTASGDTAAESSAAEDVVAEDSAAETPAAAATPAAENPAAENPEAEDPEAASVPLTDEQVSGAVEALLLMAEEPVAAATLAEAVGVPTDRITKTLQALVEFYTSTGRGFELRHVGGGWRYYTRIEHADLIGRWVVQGQQSRLSQASLETLAVVAYLQPVSRARISAVRGVSVDGVIRTLLARELIEEVGQDEQTGAVVFRTTDYFLERMGLQSLTELPAMAPHLPDAVDLEAELSELANPQVPTGGSDFPPGDVDGHNEGSGEDFAATTSPDGTESREDVEEVPGETPNHDASDDQTPSHAAPSHQLPSHAAPSPAAPSHEAPTDATEASPDEED